MRHPPIMRHEALQPLSRDHYAGLVQARRLRIASSQGAAQRRAAIEAFAHDWNALMAEHFADEERLLTNLIGDAALADRLLDEHERIRSMATTAAHLVERWEPPDPQWMRKLAAILHDHIRWEERVLFPAVEHQATEKQLDELAQATESIEEARPRWERAGRTRTSPID